MPFAETAMQDLINTLPLDWMPRADLPETLAIPFGALALLSLVLWSGRIRQRLLVNVLALGLMLPLVQLSMLMVGGHVLSQHLQFALLDMMPPWMG